MADQKLTALTATTTPILTDIAYVVVDPGASPLSRKVTLSDLQAILSIKDVADGRLTLESGVPISTSAQSNKTTLYYTFYKGNKIGLYDGTSWHVRTFAELSIAVGAYTASKPYDIWVYDNAGTPTLDSTVWTDATTRATALAYQDGVLVKSGATTRRYVGTIYIDSGQKCQDTVLLRYVYNYYNRINRKLLYTDSGSHTATNQTTWRQWNNSAAAQVAFILGVQEDDILVSFGSALYTDTNTKSAYLGFAVDATTPGDAEVGFLQRQYATAANDSMSLGRSGYKSIAAGYHYIALLEAGDTASVATFINGVLHVAVPR